MGNSFSSHLMNQEPLEAVDFAFYETACRHDADVQRFDDNLKARTEKVLAALATGVNQQSLSFDSLKEVTTSLLDVDCEVMEVILSYKDDFWKNRDLFLLVEQFFDNSQATFEFCTAAESSVKSAKDNQLILQMALNLIPTDREPDEHEMRSILSALNLFCQAGNPFGGDFILKFKAVQERHTLMLFKLRDKKRKLDKKLKNVQLWAKVSSILFVAVVAAVLICSVVAAAAIAAARIAGSLAAVSSLPLGAMGEWVKSMWRGYETEIRAEREVLQQMHTGTFAAIHDLEDIRNLVLHLETQLNSIVSDIQFTNEHTDVIALRLTIEDITTRRSSFVSDLEDLQLHIGQVGNRIQQARTIVLQIIANHTHRRRRRPGSF